MTEEQTYDVEREEDDAGGRYVVHIADGAEGEMTFRKKGAGTILIDHTFVPRSFRNTGIAQLLMDRAIADARARGTRIIPFCSYVVAQFRRHPEWSDVLAD